MGNYTGSDLGEDFKAFYSSERRKISKILTSLGCENIVMSRQFYYFYGFFTTKNGQKYYFSCSDVRHFGYDKILYRTVENYDDFRGGVNQYIKPAEFKNIKIN